MAPATSKPDTGLLHPHGHQTNIFGMGMKTPAQLGKNILFMPFIVLWSWWGGRILFNGQPVSHPAIQTQDAGRGRQLHQLQAERKWMNRKTLLKKSPAFKNRHSPLTCSV
jgi:hypothetical protein